IKACDHALRSVMCEIDDVAVNVIYVHETYEAKYRLFEETMDRIEHYVNEGGLKNYMKESMEVMKTYMKESAEVMNTYVKESTEVMNTY
ncbi:hypothetical protein KI387_025406, partial [Taxus chinensis]